MNKVLYLAIVCLFAPTWVLAGAVYKCQTPQGIVFSQTPCAADAQRVEVKGAAPRPAARATEQSGAASLGSAGSAKIEDFERMLLLSADEVLQQAGSPAARYRDDGSEYWLFPSACEASRGQRPCPELEIRDGRSAQINWLGQETMRKSVAIALGFASWTPDGAAREKTFSLSDSAVVGRNKSQVTAKLGQPDTKRVFDGREVWEYEQVRVSQDQPRRLTVYLEFEGDTVSSSVGN